MEATMDRVVEFGARIGITPTTLISLVSPLLSIPVCFVLRSIASPTLRHVFASLSGLLLALYAFGPTIWAHYAALVAFTYAAMSLHRRRCGIITLIGTFIYLVSCHVIYASGQARKDQGIDFAGTLMMVTLKLTSSAFDYQDGLYLVDATAPLPTRGANQRHIEHLPSVLQYLGYVFCGGLHLTGPFFELRPYLDWAEHRGVWAQSAEKAPFVIPMLVALAWAAGSGFVHLVLKPHLDIPLVTDPVRFGAIPYVQRWGHAVLSTYAVRCKIYYVWTVAEVSMIASGLGFSGWVPVETKTKGETTGRAAQVDQTTTKEVAAIAEANEPRMIRAAPVAEESVVASPARAPGALMESLRTNNAGEAAGVARRGKRSASARTGDFAAPPHQQENDENAAPFVYNGKTSSPYDTLSSNMPMGGSATGGFLLACAEAKDADEGSAQVPAEMPRELSASKPVESARLVACWSRAKNIDILGVELVTGFNAYARNWNMSVGVWLRTYIYERTFPVGEKPGVKSLLLTVGVSAIWHGIYIGDFMFAFSGAFLIMGSRVVYRYQRTIPPSLWLWGCLVQAMHSLYCFFGLNYIAMGFIVLTAKDTITVYRGLHFVGNLMPVVVLAGNWLIRKIHAAVHSSSSSSSSSKRQRVAGGKIVVAAAALSAKLPEQTPVLLTSNHSKSE